ncbi:MAG: hypothetical protein HFI48_02705 [Lachnospiraceae bacterium]|nr:hypothetical protein [Lachnospiraceae bacterium]
MKIRFSKGNKFTLRFLCPDWQRFADSVPERMPQRERKVWELRWITLN